LSWFIFILVFGDFVETSTCPSEKTTEDGRSLWQLLGDYRRSLKNIKAFKRLRNIWKNKKDYERL